MAEGHNDVRRRDNVYGHLPPVNEWRVVMYETPEPHQGSPGRPGAYGITPMTGQTHGGAAPPQSLKQEQGATASQQCGNFKPRDTTVFPTFTPQSFTSYHSHHRSWPQTPMVAFQPLIYWTVLLFEPEEDVPT